MFNESRSVRSDSIGMAQLMKSLNVHVESSSRMSTHMLKQSENDTLRLPLCVRDGVEIMLPSLDRFEHHAGCTGESEWELFERLS